MSERDRDGDRGRARARGRDRGRDGDGRKCKKGWRGDRTGGTEEVAGLHGQIACQRSAWNVKRVGGAGKQM